MRLLLFNLATDEADPIIGFAVNWARQLARHCERIDVLTMYRGVYALPANVRVFSAGREQGWSKPRRLLSFYRQLTRLLSTRRYDACFAHMMPLFAGLGGPLLKARGIPIVMWYTHRQVSLQLRLGLAMSRRVVTPVAGSFPLPTLKLRLTGHGIDTEFFTPPPKPIERPSTMPLVVQVGRLSAIKYQATSIRAIAETPASLILVGGSPARQATAYARQLRHLRDELILGDRCVFAGDQAAEAVRDWYRRAAVAVNTTGAGSFDKAALESMACGIPTIVSHAGFSPLLGGYRDLLTIAGPEDVAGLTWRLNLLLRLPAAEREQIGESLRRAVIRQHSMPRLIANLMSVLETGELPAS